MIRKLSSFLLTIIAIVPALNILSQAQPKTLLTQHVREVVLNRQAPSIGRLPATQSMKFDIVLQMRDQAGFESFLREVYNPSSPFYRQFLTPQDFTARFGPSQEDYNALIHFANANGFTMVGGSRDAMDVVFKGSVANIEAAFHVTLNVYQHPTENRTFYAPDREPTVDLPFQLWHVSGLDNYSIPRSALVKRSESENVKSNASTGSCPQASFCGSDMRAAYYGGTALTGTGQNVGLLEYLGFDIADVNTYYTNAKQTRTAAVTGISTDGSNVLCTEKQGCDDTEQTLDITQALGMAPGVTTVYVYVGNTDTAILGGMSTDIPLPLNLSSSWTWQPGDPKTDDPFFQKMAAQGQSYFQAAGDSGAYNAGSQYVFPADDANVISVGGTQLFTAGAGGAWSSETTWVDGGGGYFTVDGIKIPSWQQLTGVINSSNKGSTTLRNSPDVSANSYWSFYVCADQTACTANLYGGTSFAAPMWAGYLALANQQAAANGDPAPGFIDPTIYPLGLGSTYDTIFHDITTGSNGFPAVTGFDLATGWGSPNGAGLINALAPVQSTGSFTLNASPKSITVARGASGKATILSTVTGGFDAAVTLSSVSGTTFSPNPLPAPGSGKSAMTIKIGANAPLGTHTITIKGTGNGITASTKISLTVTQ